MIQNYIKPELTIIQFHTEENFAQSKEVGSKVFDDWEIEEVEW